MVEKFNFFEGMRSDSVEAEPQAVLERGRKQVEEMMTRRAEERQRQLDVARKRVEEAVLTPAVYMKELLELSLEPEERGRFERFFASIETVRKQF